MAGICDRCGSGASDSDRVCRSCGSLLAGRVRPERAITETDLDQTVDRSALMQLAGTGAECDAADPAPPPQAVPSWVRVRASWNLSPGTPSPPAQLWVVIATMGLIGVVSVGWSIYWASKALDLFSLGHLGVAVGVFILGVLAVPLSFGLGCTYLARRLQAADRVARVLTVVLCLSAAAAFILSGARDLTLVLVALVCIGVVVMLLADPATKSHFTGPHAIYGSEPSPVVASRVLMVIVGCCMFLVGVMLIPLSEIDGTLVIYGLLEIGLAGMVFWLSRRLSRGDPAARVFVTCLALLYALLSIVVGHGEPGVILPVGLALGTVGLLWLPRSSRIYFAALSRPSQPAVAAAERLVEGLISSLRPLHPHEPRDVAAAPSSPEAPTSPLASPDRSYPVRRGDYESPPGV